MKKKGCLKTSSPKEGNKKTIPYYCSLPFSQNLWDLGHEFFNVWGWWD